MTVTAEGTRIGQTRRNALETSLYAMCWRYGEKHWKERETEIGGKKRLVSEFVVREGPALTEKNVRDIAKRLRMHSGAINMHTIEFAGTSSGEKVARLKQLFGANTLTEEMYRHLARTMRPSVDEVILLRCAGDEHFTMLVHH